MFEEEWFDLAHHKMISIGKIRKALIVFFVVSLSPCFLVSPTQAAENFSSEYEVTYDVSETGLTAVRQGVTITNLTSKYFVSQYSFTIGSEEIYEVSAWDPTGSLTAEVKKKEGETTINLNFRARVFGTGRKLKFGIAYKFPGLAAKNGLLWEINLLRITNLSEIKSYDLLLSVPEKFGPLLYSSPQPKTVSSANNRQTISYTKEELLKGPPRLAFGEFQLYRLRLSYHLQNPSFTLGYTEIALPPDIPKQQQVVVENFLPRPASIRIDEDGNYLAHFNLGPREKKEVVWEGLVALFYHSRNFGDHKREAIPSELIETYTQSARYWEVEDPRVADEAQKLFDPNLSVAENAKVIFDFVVGHLSYDYTKLAGGTLERLGAAKALEEPKRAVCMEYTDLFIALSRAMGIPAREVNGFAVSADESYRPLSLRLESGDVLHAWPEVYLPQKSASGGNLSASGGWVMVDPTWSSTSGADYFSAFDLSHITFVRKGKSSEYPLPAGSYKAEAEGRDVEVSFPQEISELSQLPQLSVEILFPFLSVSPFKTTATVKVRNSGNTAAFGTKLFLGSNLLEIAEEETIALGTIPPGGVVERTVSLKPRDFRTRGEEKLAINLSAEGFAGEKLTAFAEEETTVNPLYLPLPAPYLAVLFTGVILSLRLKRLILHS